MLTGLVFACKHMASTMALICLLAIAAPLTLHAAEQQHRDNPIRKVVTMLQGMQKKR
jgi:hypothetical protein